MGLAADETDRRANTSEEVRETIRGEVKRGAQITKAAGIRNRSL